METMEDAVTLNTSRTSLVRTWVFFGGGAALICLGMAPALSAATALNLAAFALAGAGTSAALYSLRASRLALGKEMRRWRLLFLAMTLFTLGELYRLAFQLVQGSMPPRGGIEDLLYLAGFLTFVPVVLLMTEPFEVLSVRRLRNTLDLLSMLVWALVLAYLGLLVPLQALQPGMPPAETLSIIAYPVACAGLLLYLLAFKRSRWNRPDSLIAGAFAAGLVAAVLSVRYGALGLYGPHSRETVLVDLAVYTSFGLIAAAASYRNNVDEGPQRVVRPEMDLPHWPGIISQGLALIGIPALIITSGQLATPAEQLVVTASAAILAALVVARSAVITLENRRLAEQSLVDPLTGLFNRRHFRTAIAQETHLAIRENEPLSVATLELDRFDDLNRRFGFGVGDQLLKHVARTLDSHVRDSDLCFRLGGDEFAILMPATRTVEAYVACTRILDSLHQLGASIPEPLRASIGIATIPLHTTSDDELLRYSEGAVYWAKAHGGDRVVVFDPAVVDVLDSSQHITNLERASHTQMVEVLAAAVDARDPYTQFHSRNVAMHAETLARAAGLDVEQTSLVHSAGLLHDVGKIGISDQILRKPSRLEPDEFERIREHPTLGVRILQASARREILPWIQSHHERWDGHGYPDSLPAEGIPFEARILAICDAFDAMTTDRPYRPALDVAHAIAELEANSGTQFDPELVRLFVHLLKRGEIDAPPPMSAK